MVIIFIAVTRILRGWDILVCLIGVIVELYRRFKFPYPLQWGPPTFAAGHSVAMMASVLVSMIEVPTLYLNVEPLSPCIIITKFTIHSLNFDSPLTMCLSKELNFFWTKVQLYLRFILSMIYSFFFVLVCKLCSQLLLIRQHPGLRLLPPLQLMFWVEA